MRQLSNTGAQVQSRETGSADIVNVIQQSYNVSGWQSINVIQQSYNVSGWQRASAWWCHFLFLHIMSPYTLVPQVCGLLKIPNTRATRMKCILFGLNPTHVLQYFCLVGSQGDSACDSSSSSHWTVHFCHSIVQQHVSNHDNTEMKPEAQFVFFVDSKSTNRVNLTKLC